MTSQAAPSIGYVTDAASNNAQTLFGAAAPNVTSLVDLLGVVQACVLNDVIVVSRSAMKRSALLQALPFADTFHVTETVRDGEEVVQIDGPKGVPVDNDIIIDVNDEGHFSTGTAIGDLLLLATWGEALQEDPILGSLFVPDPEELGLGDRYMAKMAAFVTWLQADRGALKFQDSEAKAYFAQQTAGYVARYSQFARQAITCRDVLGVNLYPSAIEEPLFALSVAREVSSPFTFLEDFDTAVRHAIEAGRSQAFERWGFPSIGASVVARAGSLDKLPKEILRARDALLPARNNIRRLNAEMLEFEQNLDFGNDRHLPRLEEHKTRLRRGLEAFVADTEYDEEQRAFPITERVWWLPKLLVTALGAMSSPAKAIDSLSGMPWLRRKSYLRYVPGLSGAASYLGRLRAPIMEHLVQNVLAMEWQQAQQQAHFVGSALDLIERCADLRDAESIGNKVLFTMESPDGETVDVTEDRFWFSAVLEDGMRERFLLGRGENQ